MNINLTLIAQAISFSLFILFTVKFVWPPLMKAIENRQKQIADIVAHAEQRATQMSEAAKNAAKEEGNREKVAAKAEIAQEATRAREALREQVAALAVSGAERILQREVDAQAHAELLAQLKQEL
jgi:F-type H+-transporting ATPase subunit b